MIQEDPKENAYDASCKRILSYKSILAWILKDALEECKNLSIPEIMAGSNRTTRMKRSSGSM